MLNGVRFLAGMALVVGLLGQASAVADHCRAFELHTGLVHSGVDIDPMMPSWGGLGCLASPAPHESVDYITPGATLAQLRVTNNNQGVMPTGNFRINGGSPIAMTFFFEPTRSLWWSQVLQLPADVSTIRVTVNLEANGGTRTYRQLA